MYSRFVLAQVNALFFLEFSYEEIHNHLVKIVAAQTVVTAGSFYFEEAVAQFKDRNVEGTAAQVIDEDGLVFCFFQTVSQCSCSRLVHDTQNFQTGDFTCILCSLTLAVIEIRRNRDNSLSNRLSQVSFGIGFQFLQNHGRDLLCRVVFAVNAFFVVRAHMAFDGSDGAVRVRNRLAFGCFTDDTFAVLLEAYNRWGCARAFRIRNNDSFAAFHYGNARVGGS
ncbi:NAD-specific glutamate dehydrogenase [compost metagenome]